jgi:hypothetical protein
MSKNYEEYIKMREKSIAEMKEIDFKNDRAWLWVVFFCVFTVLSFLLGLHKGMAGDCRSNSLMGLLNIPHRVGCELVKKRGFSI